MTSGAEIELDRTRSVGEIVRAALDLYRRYPLLFLILAAAVMVPYELVVFAATGRGPLGRTHESFVTLMLLSVLGFSLISPLISALHVHAYATSTSAVRGKVSIGRLLLLLLLALAVAVVVLNWTYGHLPSESRATGSSVQVGKLRIHYLERPGSGTPVVLIHGLPGTAEDWEDVTPLLAGHRTIAIDRPGFGYSTGGYLPFDRQLETIDELLHKLHIVRAILVGHSYGGTISLGFAERYPNKVRGLVLVDAAAGGTHPDGFARFQAHFLHFLQLPVIWQIADVTFSQLLRKASAELAESEAFHPQAVVAAHRQRVLAISMTRGNLEALAGEYLAADGAIKQVDRGLGAVKPPSIVIQGDADKLVEPIYGRRLAAALPDSHLVMVYGGHMQPYDHPAAIAAAVEGLSDHRVSR